MRRGADAVMASGEPMRVVDLASGGGVLTNPLASRAYTDMMEAACMSVLVVDQVPGQAPVTLDALAPVLDDILVQWSNVRRCVGAGRRGLLLTCGPFRGAAPWMGWLDEWLEKQFGMQRLTMCTTSAECTCAPTAADSRAGAVAGALAG